MSGQQYVEFDENRDTFFGKNVWWRERYRPVLAGPVDGRALYFTLPLLLRPSWPETPLIIMSVLFLFWFLMSRKIEPDNVPRFIRSHIAGRIRTPVSRHEMRMPKDYGFETREMMETEQKLLDEAVEKHEAEFGKDERDLKPKPLRVARCVMG